MVTRLRRIIHETTVPYMPQQNGVAKRKNRALKEMINSMLSYSGLSEVFRGEAMLMACYLLNRVLNKRNKTTPYELWDDHSNDVPSETPKPRKGKRVRKAKSYGYDFQLYLVKGSTDQVGSQYSYCYSIEEDPRTYNEAIQSRDAAFWKEAIDDEIDLAAIHNLVIHQIDVKTSFLNGDLDEEVYMKQLEGFVMPGNEHK
ncbi:zinc finger, CCHC-type containing protein, partial [Tanacetum coccineum]